jgi:hypothetical protein
MLNVSQFELETGTISPGGAPKVIAAKADSSGYQKVSLGTRIAGEEIGNDLLKIVNPMTPVNLTASALVKTGAGRVAGFYVNSTTSGVIKFWDNTSAATTAITGNITPAVGAHAFPADGNFGTGLYVQVVSGTIDITVFYN